MVVAMWLRGRYLTFAVILAMAGALFTVTAAAPAAAASDGSATIVGRGWGHGRGMGQYGALGYAVDHGWGYQQILAHYYGGTTLQANSGNPTVGIELSALKGADAILTGTGLAVNGAGVGAAAVLVRRSGDGTFGVWTGPGCGGPWTQWRTGVGSGLTVTTSSLINACTAAAVRGYRGDVQVVDAGGVQYGINRLPAEEYLLGVVPRESPASWADLGNGAGMNAMKAQAVAARSYALSSGARASGALTCDTTACQVYLGATEWIYSGATKMLEDARSSAAVNQTASQVMRTGSGGIARTEFSSSTGGWTAGGAFTAVEDAGDAIARNPNHSWSLEMDLATMAAKLGVGTISSLGVTARNGLGSEGGRVSTLLVTLADGQRVSFTGSDVRIKLGLKSDWFTITALSAIESRRVVTSLYRDILGREPDAAGLQLWVDAVLRTGGSAVVASGIVMSTERLQTFVAAEYQNALGRGPDPTGLAFWTSYLQGGTTIPELQAFIYSSDEGIGVAHGDLGVWVDRVYLGILGRSAGPTERSYWIAQIGSAGAANVVRSIAKSDEAGMRRLNSYYTTMLGRGADATGVAGFLPLMAGNGDFVLPIALGGSAEYWQRSQSRCSCLV